MEKKVLQNKYLKYALAIFFWLLVWYIVARMIDNDLLLVTPLAALKVLAGLTREAFFWKTILLSLSRIVGGLLTGVAIGILAAVLSYRFALFELFLKPFMSTLKAIPVVSFVVLLLIWWGPRFLSFWICFLIVFPVLYMSVLEGLKNTPGELLEMAQVYQLPVMTRIWYLYRPSIKPYLNSSLSLALGMCWKSGVAAEVIGTPALSIGERLYLSKIYLDTGALFAWTAVIILLSITFEKLCMVLVEFFFALEPHCRKRKEKETEPPQSLVCSSLSKAFGEKTVFERLEMTFPAGEVSWLTWESGKGKTTLFRIIAGLESPEAGEITGNTDCVLLFQEDRLCLEYDAVKNVEMVTGDRRRSREALQKLLGAEELSKPCALLSGGERRRVALVRAMEASAGVVLLDEPFTGLDQETMQRVKHYIEERKGGRTLVIASHIR